MPAPSLSSPRVAGPAGQPQQITPPAPVHGHGHGKEGQDKGKDKHRLSLPLPGTDPEELGL